MFYKENLVLNFLDGQIRDEFMRYQLSLARMELNDGKMQLCEYVKTFHRMHDLIYSCEDGKKSLPTNSRELDKILRESEEKDAKILPFYLNPIIFKVMVELPTLSRNS